MKTNFFEAGQFGCLFVFDNVILKIWD